MSRLSPWPEASAVFTAGRSRIQRLARIALVLAMFVILGLTLVSDENGQPGASAARVLFCLRCGAYWLQDLVANLVLFLPIGACAVLGGLRIRYVVGAGFLLSLAIECGQYFAIPGRDGNFRDVLANTAGVIFGTLLARYVRSISLPTPATAHRLVWACGMATAAFSVGASLLLAPSGSNNPVWVQFEPELEGLDRVCSVVREASFDGLALPDGRLASWRELRTSYGQAKLAVSVRVAGKKREGHGASVLLSLADPSGPDVAKLGFFSGGWWGTFGMRAEDIGLRAPYLRLAETTDAAFPVVATIAWNGPEQSLTVRSAGGTSSMSISLSPILVWVPFFPFPAVLSGNFQWMSLAWVLGISLVLGWWAGRGGHLPLLIVAGAWLAIAAFLPPLLFTLASPPVWSWAAALFGLVTGSLAARVSSRPGGRLAFAKTAAPD